MKPRQKIADAEISKYYKEIRDDRKIGRMAAPPAVCDARMKESGIGLRPDVSVVLLLA
jgi:hypothetical protein